MTINWYGQACFKILAQKSKEPVSVIIDPPTKSSGIRGPKLDADVLLLSDSKEKFSPADNCFVIDMPGEYDIKEIYVKGIQSKDLIIYVLEIEDVKVCHLGKINQTELTTEQLETIGDVDILMLPIDGGDIKTAIKIMSQIEPKITIPMHKDSLNSFLKMLGIEKIEKLPKLTIKKKDLPQGDEAKIIALEI
jgi:hypothetical protein